MKSKQFILVAVAIAVLIGSCKNPVNGNESTPSPSATPAIVGSGTTADPYQVTVGTPFAVPSTAATSSLNFKFDVEQGAYYDITISAASGSIVSGMIAIYSNSDFTSMLAMELGESVENEELRAGTYYAAATLYGNGTSLTITITKKSALTYEGSKTAPQVLTIGTTYAAKTDYSSYPYDRSSYYSISVPSDGIYLITATAVSSGSVYLGLYAKSDFSSSADSATVSATGSSTGFPARGFTAGTYYLRVYAIESGAKTFNVTMTRTGDYTAEGSTANPIDLSQDVDRANCKVGRVSGTLDSYYRFSTTESGVYQILASSLPSTISLNFTIYDQANLSSSVAYTSSSTNGIPTCQLGIGTWILVVHNPWTSAAADPTYTLRVSRTGGTISEGSMKTPVQLSLGTEYADGKVGSYSTSYHSSYYSFTTTASGVYHVSVSGLSSGSVGLTLYSSSTYSSTLADGTASAGLDVGLSAAGTWYLSVYNSESLNKTYRLTVTRTGDYATQGTVASPLPLAIGSNSVRASGIDNMDYSYYVFTLTQSGTYDVAPSAALSTPINFTVYTNATFSSYLFSASSSTTGITAKAFQPGTYYLKTYNSSDATLDYSLAITRTGDYPAEGSVAAPVTLTPGTTRSGCIVGASDNGADCSYYAFTVATAGNYSISTSGLSSGATLYLYGNSNFSSSFVASASATAGISSAALTAKTYYLIVDNYSSSGATYSLTVTQLP